MKVSLTAQEIWDRGIWAEFCDLSGINPWARNEGLIADDAVFTLTEEQAMDLGLIRRQGEWY